VAQFAISIISWEYFFILVSRHGRTALDVSQYMRVIIGFLGVFIWSFASTTSTMVSNVIGQGRRDDVMPVVRRILRLSLGVSLVMSLPLELFPGGFLRIVRDDPDFIRQGIPVVRVVAAAMVLMSVATIWLNAVTGTGNTRVNLAIEAVTVVVYAVYVREVLVVRNMPIEYGWMSEWVYWTCMFSLSWLYLRSGRWRSREI
jgi:Na+-driven multidrug efflux pump